MYKERAKKFCKLCHEYDRNKTGPLAARIGYYKLRDHATAEAMRALEYLCRIDGTPKQMSMAISNVLKGCYHCDYSKPTIVEMLEKKEE